jgi:hypothetical protein
MDTGAGACETNEVSDSLVGGALRPNPSGDARGPSSPGGYNGGRLLRLPAFVVLGGITLSKASSISASRLGKRLLVRHQA